MNKGGYVYILTNYTKTTFYIGVTANLDKRISEHRSGLIEGFSKKYKLTMCVYFEEYPPITEAIKREKQLKNWHRGWKLNLIKSTKPFLRDLTVDAETILNQVQH